MGRGLKGQTKTPAVSVGRAPRELRPAARTRPKGQEAPGWLVFLHFSSLRCHCPCRVTGEEPATASSVCGCVGLGWRSLGTTGWVVLVSQSGHSLEFTRALSRGLANPLALDRGVCSRRLLARPRGLPGAPGTYPIWDARQSGDGVVGGVGRPAFSVSQLRMAILVKRTK